MTLQDMIEVFQQNGIDLERCKCEYCFTEDFWQKKIVVRDGKIFCSERCEREYFSVMVRG